ncbi:MAG TPA: hemerythrin domain-containing protein [Noviherbaspirillum sp.]|uniref:hemerythrin domain-containing protein n=1 Tax=Noviherbaspirillum sp. TaxID=1926288 RepID=UPI002D6177B5|nr:hemerythrin domain-containing protein [Noviherbaspirillum sp.]HYD94874.1 hemerythrin domain-containing protein [Noviherbaspirillum sp.]
MPRNATSKSSSKSSSRTTRRASTKGSETDALHILAEDHKKVIDLFDEFEKMKENEETDDEAKQMLVETACAELTIHAQVEEEIFYPAARDAIDDMDLLDEAEVEHASARQLISELAAMQPDDDLYDAKFTVLGEYVKHHIQEEEKELFPKLKKAELDLEEIGEEIRDRKMELREELGVASDEDDDDDPGSQRKVH